MKLVYPVLAIVIVTALVLTLPVFYSSTADFSTYNTGWNGCSQLKALNSQDQSVNRQVTVVSSLSAIKGTTSGVLVMLNPPSNLTSDEIATVNAFVENGGALLLANNFGQGNDVLAGMGVYQAVHFNGTLLRDDSNNWWSGEFPLVFNFANSTITNGVSTVYLNYATALDVANGTGGANVTVLAQSSPTSYLSDAPLAGQQSSNASGYGEKPVLAYLTHGKGAIVVCSDPSIFINFMLGNGDNERLYTNLITNLTRGDTGAPVYFDESHRAVESFWVALYGTINADDLSRYAFIVSLTGLLVAGVGVSRLVEKRRRPDETPAEVALDERVVVDDMIRRNPRWSRSRVELLIRNVRTRKKR
jgi:hypothetical protein